jgi:hypothetical protein
MAGLRKSKEPNLDVRDNFFQGHILSSTAGDGCSKRIKLLRDQGQGSRGGKKTNKRPNFYFLKSLGAKNSAPRGKQGREESNFQDSMTKGASNRVYIYNLHLG